ncbi:hypothetical protein [Brevibacillus brevis]|uniref:Uncharacterized protein n=1 Tax=Brevibacillus brevis TaxID=1393 RepID=A0A517IE85_BREBE|nr:hypothetical protein [Brevibacillus brevis]QDS37196.1 hypothetical protein FPS98_26355 [Brevibacillus brevis]
MKKRSVFIFGLVLAGAVFVGSNLYASEDVERYEKSNHQKTLHALGIEAEPKDVERMNTLTDGNGKKWIYTDFIDRGTIIEKMDSKYTEDVGGAFIQVHDKIMQKYAKVGDTIPVILLDEELKEGYFAFNRQEGETLSFKIKYDNGAWEYELQK